MFVVWQNEKPHVITDHTYLGINNSIPQSEAKVKYDNMQTFSQNLHNAHLSNPGRCLVTFKSDVTSAFLNLPAHPCNLQFPMCPSRVCGVHVESDHMVPNMKGGV